MMKRTGQLGIAAFAAMLAGTAIAHEPHASETQQLELRERLPEDEVVYFVLPDRFANGDSSNDTGGIEGDRLSHGYDPTHKGFYHGGDLAGLTERLDYLGGDVAAFRAMSSGDCAAACDSDPACTRFTYATTTHATVAKRKMCWLKNDEIEASRANSGAYISGQKR